MRKFLFMMAILVLTGLMGGSALADSVTVSFDAGTTNFTTALTEFQTYGSNMAGMKVTAYFSTGPSETATWATTGYDSGAASGTGWSLYENGDTFDQQWKLINKSGLSITRILIDAGPGNSVFDRTFGGVIGTTGSELGKDFAVFNGGFNYDILATYRDLVALTGYAPVGDLYRSLDIVFNNRAFTTTELDFKADTDNIKFAGDLGPVPLPSAVFLLGSGLLGLAGWRRFRKG